jgi:hypothetical protein
MVKPENICTYRETATQGAVEDNLMADELCFQTLTAALDNLKCLARTRYDVQYYLMCEYANCNDQNY